MVNFRVKECDLSDNATLSAQNDDSLRDRKLKVAGYAYLLGDAAMYGAAAARGEKLAGNKLAAASWAAGGVGAAIYGNPSSEKKLGIQARKLETYLKQQGVTIPDSVREQNALLKSPTLWEHITGFLYEHPSEILNAGYAIGAATLIKSAIPSLGKTHSLLGTGGHKLSTDFWIGATVLGGALGGLFLKEDPQAREKAKDAGNGAFARAKAWVIEKPLRFSSALYTANNMFLAGRAYQDFSARGTHIGAMKPHYFSTLQLATYLFGNAMLLMSSRDQFEGKVMPMEHLAQMEDAAARVIAAQPAQVQQELLTNVSRYMAEQKNIDLDAPQLAQALANRITQLTGERVQQAANTVSWTAREQARLQAAPTQPAL